MDGSDKLLSQSLLAQTQAGPRIAPVKSVGEARRVAEDFEAFFLAQMIQHMFTGIPTDGPYGGGHAETIYRSLLSDEYGKLVSRAGGIGIADAVYREILKLQESES
ncbi:MAG: rod-binding protein [Proteobacteria bacterium]|nr:rod-binding protein [Pseudomonadota bacterium]